MSTFEDYSSKADSYYVIRQAVGIEIIVGCLAQNKIPLNEMHILDAGCGTGNYTRALLPFVECIVGIDKSQEMLTKASQICGKTPKVEFHLASIEDALPFPENSFDAVLITQVLHHLGDQAPSFPKHRHVLREFRRVLKPKGIVIISSSSELQLTNSAWYFSLFPEHAIKAFSNRHIRHTDLIHLLETEGFSYCGKFVPVDAPLQGKAYFETSGPLNEGWRNSNSIWREVTIAELETIVGNFERMSLSERKAYMEDHDRIRQNIGQPSFLYAVLESECRSKE